MKGLQTVLVVDDDQIIVELLQDFLENEGFLVKKANDAKQALDLFEHSGIDCMILDIMMPGQNGFDFCRHVRETSDVPILFLSARSDDVDKIRGLALGGDDYIVKTASPGEIMARVKAVLRRSNAQREQKRQLLQYGCLSIDLSTREVSINDNMIALTPKEYELLRLLAEHPHFVFTYEQLLEKFWDGIGDNHTVRVHMSRLREKIEARPNDSKFIVNVWGIGYRFIGDSHEDHSYS